MLVHGLVDLMALVTFEGARLKMKNMLAAFEGSPSHPWK